MSDRTGPGCYWQAPHGVTHFEGCVDGFRCESSPHADNGTRRLSVPDDREHPVLPFEGFDDRLASPFACGLRTGREARPPSPRTGRQSRIVSWVGHTLPLSESHWIGCGPSERWRVDRRFRASNHGSSPRDAATCLRTRPGPPRSQVIQPQRPRGPLTVQHADLDPSEVQAAFARDSDDLAAGLEPAVAGVACSSMPSGTSIG